MDLATLDATPGALPNARYLSEHTQRVIEIRILPLGARSGRDDVGEQKFLEFRPIFPRIFQDFINFARVYIADYQNMYHSIQNGETYMVPKRSENMSFKEGLTIIGVPIRPNRAAATCRQKSPVWMRTSPAGTGHVEWNPWVSDRCTTLTGRGPPSPAEGKIQRAGFPGGGGGGRTGISLGRIRHPQGGAPWGRAPGALSDTNPIDR